MSWAQQHRGSVSLWHMGAGGSLSIKSLALCPSHTACVRASSRAAQHTEQHRQMLPHSQSCLRAVLGLLCLQLLCPVLCVGKDSTGTV